MPVKTIFRKTVSNLTDVNEITQYLHNNYQQARIVVNVWEHYIRRPDHYITNENEIKKLEQYLVNYWDSVRITIIIREQNRWQ